MSAERFFRRYFEAVAEHLGDVNFDELDSAANVLRQVHLSGNKVTKTTEPPVVTGLRFVATLFCDGQAVDCRVDGLHKGDPFFNSILWT